MPNPSGRELREVIASNVTELLFTKYDKSGGGKLDKKKEWPPCFKYMCELFKIRYDKSNQDKWFDQIDHLGNGRGMIDKKEMQAAIIEFYDGWVRGDVPKPVVRERHESDLDRRVRVEVDRLWTKYDRDRNGYLDKTEFKLLFLEVNLSLKIRYDKDLFE